LCLPCTVLASDLDFSSLFGDGNHIHPFITLETTWSDNIFKTKDDTKSDTVIYTSPGIWFALPGAETKAISVETASESPGGASLTRFNDMDMIRYQTYFLYNPEFETYLDNTDQNDVNHKAEGYFLYNFAGGLSIELLDQFIASHDDIALGLDNVNYNNNYLCGTLSYDVTEKLRLRMDYTQYDVNYESLANYKDRVDNTLSSYIFFKIQPKTSIFFQYYNTDINYDMDTDPLKSIDSTENGYLAGVRWNITNKTSGTFKAGYQTKDFDRASFADVSTLKFELNANYEISGHSSLSLTAKDELSETDTDDAYYIQADSLLAVYEQALTERFTGFMSANYLREDYGDIDRTDTTLDVSPSLSYVFNNRLTFNAAYTYEHVSSSGSDAVDDYTKNTILLSASASF